MKGRRFFRLTCAAAVLLVTAAVNTSAEPISSILARAADLLGAPYRSGGVSPQGFDCSGFVTYLYKSTLPDLPRVSRHMADTGEAVAQGQWQPGDLLFYATGANPSRINHVAIWYGEGRVIHSISGGPQTGVVITLGSSRYWKQRYISARRVLPPEASADNPASAELPPKVPPSVGGEESLWNDFDGILQGDYDAWKKEDEEAFEAYKRENG